MVLSGHTFQRVVLRTVLAFLSLVTVARVAGQPSELAGTMPEDYLPELKQILTAALQRSPEIVGREFERMAAEARVDVARSSMLPQLGGNFNYGSTETATASNTSSKTRDNGFFYSFGLNQAVWHWGALKNQYEIGRISLLLQERNYAQAYRDLSVVLRKTYLSLIAEKARLRQNREALKLLRNDVEITRAKKEVGSASAAAVAGDELRLRESTLDLNRAESEFTNSRTRFARLAGLPEFPEDRIPNEIPAPAFSEPRISIMTATFLRDNAKGTIEYNIYDLRLREALLRQKIEAVRLYPKFGASAGYSLENNTNVNGNVAEQRAVARQTLAIGGSWAMFDGFATRGVKREALIARRSLEHRKTVDIEQMLQNAQALDRSLKLDAEQLELSEIRRNMSVEAQRRVANEVQFGNLPKGTVDRARMSVLQAEARNTESRAAYLSRWSEFVALVGEDPVLSNLPARYLRAKN